MAFSPSVYGDRAAAALNVMANVYRWSSGKERNTENYYTKTQPEGTLFEADLLLSCNYVRTNAVNYMLCCMDPMDYQFDNKHNYASLFFTDPTQYTAMVNEYNEAHESSAQKLVRSKIKQSVLNSILEFRKSIRNMAGPEEPLQTPTFSDTVFGPHVAKVMNSILQVEIQLTENEITISSLPEDRNKQETVFNSLMQSSSLSDQRKSFALRSGKGTAFAGDFLVLQHFRSQGSKLKDGNDNALPLVRDAFFPEFEYDVKRRKSLKVSVPSALINVRGEMVFLTDVVHKQALPILMAGIHRLGRESLFRDMDRELMCMIAHLVIFGEMPK
jgi:hypothetical protein